MGEAFANRCPVRDGTDFRRKGWLKVIGVLELSGWTWSQSFSILNPTGSLTENLGKGSVIVVLHGSHRSYFSRHLFFGRILLAASRCRITRCTSLVFTNDISRLN